MYIFCVLSKRQAYNHDLWYYKSFANQSWSFTGSWLFSTRESCGDLTHSVFYSEGGEILCKLKNICMFKYSEIFHEGEEKCVILRILTRWLEFIFQKTNKQNISNTAENFQKCPNTCAEVSLQFEIESPAQTLLPKLIKSCYLSYCTVWMFWIIYSNRHWVTLCLNKVPTFYVCLCFLEYFLMCCDCMFVFFSGQHKMELVFTGLPVEIK